MTARIDKYREKLAAAELEIARASLLVFLRKVARRRVYVYAARHHITDFSDVILVEQSHRNFRQSVIDAASTRAAAIQSAATVGDLLIVFDEMADFIEQALGG